jgi:CRP-like cAMP-binding protein
VLLRPLMFFKKFDKEIRDSIIKKGELNCYPAGHVVFKQGSYGDKMYIILRGSVNVIINYTDPMTSLPQSKVVAWMKDGSSFGEYAMLGSKTRGIKESILSTIARVTNDIQKRVTYLKRAIVYNQQIDLKANNPIIEEKKKKQEEEALLKSGKTSNYQERTKRAADIVATEDLLMLELSREFFREIILNTIKDEYERKMRLISELPFFKVDFD